MSIYIHGGGLCVRAHVTLAYIAAARMNAVHNTPRIYHTTEAYSSKRTVFSRHYSFVRFGRAFINRPMCSSDYFCTMVL